MTPDGFATVTGLIWTALAAIALVGNAATLLWERTRDRLGERFPRLKRQSRLRIAGVRVHVMAGLPPGDVRDVDWLVEAAERQVMNAVTLDGLHLESQKRIGELELRIDRADRRESERLAFTLPAIVCGAALSGLPPWLAALPLGTAWAIASILAALPLLGAWLLWSGRKDA